MMAMIRQTKVQDVEPGDVLDLEGDRYADPRGCDSYLRYEYVEVVNVEQETPERVVIEASGYTVGFPTNHRVKVVED